MAAEASSAEFKPFVATETYVAVDSTATKTFTLQPQTTPFAPPGNLDCGFDLVYCPYQPGSMEASAECFGRDYIDKSRDDYVSKCYPESFIDMVWPTPGPSSYVNTLAYPGTACPSGYSSACDKSMTIVNVGIQQQTWCCPEGGWTCADDNPLERRDCVSVLNDPAQSIWILDTSSQNQQTTVDFDIFVRRPVIALGSVNSVKGQPSATGGESEGEVLIVADPTGAGGNGGDDGSAMENNASGGNGDGNDSGLSNGAVAGIAVGVSMLFFIIIAVGIWIACRKRRKMREEQEFSRAQSRAASSVAAMAREAEAKRLEAYTPNTPATPARPHQQSPFLFSSDQYEYYDDDMWDIKPSAALKRSNTGKSSYYSTDDREGGYSCGYGYAASDGVGRSPSSVYLTVARKPSSHSMYFEESPYPRSRSASPSPFLAELESNISLPRENAGGGGHYGTSSRSGPGTYESSGSSSGRLSTIASEYGDTKAKKPVQPQGPVELP